MENNIKTAFVCDSGTGKSILDMEAQGCFSVPLQVSYDNISKLELEEISIDEVYALMDQGKKISTSLASLGEIESLFSRLKNQGYERVFAVPICSGLSGTINAMKVAAEEIGIDFDYFDCHVTAVVEEYMVVRAKQLYDEGKTIDFIKEHLDKICETTNTLLVPDDLGHLKRGGRLTPLAATVGGLLKIKPVLAINKKTEGKIDIINKVRTMSKALDSTIDIMKKEILNNGSGYRITVAHVRCEEAGQALVVKYREFFPLAKYSLIDLVSVVGIHTGFGCLAVQYFKEL